MYFQALIFCVLSLAASEYAPIKGSVIGKVSAVDGFVGSRSGLGAIVGGLDRGIDSSRIIGAGNLRRTGSFQSSSLLNKLENGRLNGGVGGCTYECGIDQLCPSEYKCVETGCNRRCELKSVVRVSGFDNVRGPSRVLGLGSRGVGRSDIDVLSRGSILDTVSRHNVFGGRRSSVDVIDGITGSRVIDGLTFGSRRHGGCIKECISDHDCLGNKICILRGCNMVCGRRSAKGYSR